jgi:hypothetical protein
MSLSSVAFGVMLIIAFLIQASVQGTLATFVGILIEPPLNPAANPSGSTSVGPAASSVPQSTLTGTPAAQVGGNFTEAGDTDAALNGSLSAAELDEDAF